MPHEGHQKFSQTFFTRIVLLVAGGAVIAALAALLFWLIDKYVL
jgi:hypothetical protein